MGAEAALLWVKSRVRQSGRRVNLFRGRELLRTRENQPKYVLWYKSSFDPSFGRVSSLDSLAVVQLFNLESFSQKPPATHDLSTSFYDKDVRQSP